MAQGTITNSIGTKIEINTGTTGSPVWYELTNIQSIGEIGGDAAEIDVTTLNDAETSLLPGVKAFSAVHVVCFKEKESAANGGNYLKLRAIEAAGTVQEVKITFPDLTGIKFNARIVTKVNAVAVNGAVTFTASLFKSGAYTDISL